MTALLSFIGQPQTAGMTFFRGFIEIKKDAIISSNFDVSLPNQ